MTNFFCADNSRQLGEDIIGEASTHRIYVLVECPTPWTSNDFDSKYVPDNLKYLINKVQQLNISVRFLLIHSETSNNERCTKIIIFSRKEGLSDGYSKLEVDVPNITEAATVIKEFLEGNHPGLGYTESQTRDILVCTHGSHDKCCAKYGNPFYKKALATVSDLSLSNVRIWQSSHFGGHRFAPTAIDFPEGRYYGVLDRESFSSILTRTGDIKCLNKVYRGWGILPNLVQVLERELILFHGWDWFSYKVIGTMVESNDDLSLNRVELNFEKPNGSSGKSCADIVIDESKTLYTKGSCYSDREKRIPKFSVKNLQLSRCT